MIRYRRTGGFAGEETILEIDEDGKFIFRRTLSGRPIFDFQGNLDPSIWEDLTALLQKVDFSSLKEEYRAKIPVIDGFTQTLTFSTHDMTKTVTATTEADIPSAFHEIVTRLEEIMKDVYSRSST